MPTVKRVTKTDVNAPLLTQNQQNINIPQDAFGENVGAAGERFGDSISVTGQKVGQALVRRENRRSTTEALTAFKDVPISQFNALEEAKKNPGDLKTFEARMTAQYDQDMAALREGLSPRARLKFDQKSLATRTSLAKNAATWANGQEIIEGRDSMAADIQNEIAVAPGDLGNLGQHEQNIVDTITQADADGSLVAVGRQKPINPAELINSSIRKMHKEIANSLVAESPEQLRKLLDSGRLTKLTEEDERKFRSLADSSSANIVEKHTITTRDAYFAKNEEFSKKFHGGILTWTEADREQESLQGLVDSGDEDAKKQQAMLIKIRDRLATPEEEKQRKATESAERRIIATAEAKQNLGIAKVQKPSKAQQGNKFVELTNRFLDFGGKKSTNQSTKGQFVIKDASVRLSDLLDFQNDIEDALDQQLITLAQHNAWQTKLMPTLRKKIESKHFEERSGVFVPDRVADKYSDGFSYVLENLEGTELDTSANKADALLSVFQIAESLNIDAEEDPVKRKELLQSVGKRAVNELYRQSIPEINNLSDEQFPDTAITTAETIKPEFPEPSQAIIDRMNANKDDPRFQKFFIKNFGQKQFDVLIK